MKNFKTCVKGILNMLRPLMGKVTVSVLIGLVRIAASLTFVWVSKKLVDIVTGVSDAPLDVFVILLIAIMLVQIAGNIGASYWENYMSVKASNKLRYDTFGKVIGSTWNGMEAFRSGDAVNRLEEDVRVVNDLLCSRIPAVIVTLCQLLASSIFLLTLAPKLLWLLLLFMVVAVLGSRLYFGKIRELTRKIRSEDADIQQYMQENLLNRVLVLTLVGTVKVMDKLGVKQKEFKDDTMSRLNYNSFARALMNFGFSAGYIAAFLWGVLGIKAGTVTYGMMTAFLQLVGQVQRPVAEISHHVSAFIHSLISVERILDLQELEQEDGSRPVLLDHAPEIVIDNVTFSYPESPTPVLKDFSYRFPAGSMTAIVGPTGEGKSTLVRIIMGLLHQSGGQVTIDGIPADVNTRCNFMYVPQGNSLMSGTIRENLLMADNDALESDMFEALELVQAGFVKDLPDGLDTRCGEVGSGLSEGQSQRIAIARALLHPGGVLIMDESTSALDSETEQKLLENLYNKYHGSKTILFISHRDSVVRYADSILAL